MIKNIKNHNIQNQNIKQIFESLLKEPFKCAWSSTLGRSIQNAENFSILSLMYFFIWKKNLGIKNVLISLEVNSKTSVVPVQRERSPWCFTVVKLASSLTLNNMDALRNNSRGKNINYMQKVGPTIFEPRLKFFKFGLTIIFNSISTAGKQYKN